MDKNLKVGYVISNLANSGPVNILYGIIKYMDLKKIKIYIFTLKKENKNSRIKEFEKLGAIIIPVDISYKDLVFNKISKFEYICKKEKIDILHSHCFKSCLLLAKLDYIKKLNTIHLDFFTDFVFKYGQIKAYFLKKIYLKNLKKMDLNISCGKGVRELNLNNAKLKSDYIQNGIDLETFSISGKKKEELRKNLKLDSNIKYFISVGSLDERKNIFNLAKIFSNLKNKNYKLMIIGSGKEKEKILKLNSKNIIFLGQLNISEVKDYLKASDFYISASRSEGLPNSVLEACAMGLPCVLSDIKPHEEILEMESNAGLLYKLNCKEDLKDKIQKIVKVDYDKYSENSLKIVKNYLNAKNMSRKYFSTYKHIMKK